MTTSNIELLDTAARQEDGLREEQWSYNSIPEQDRHAPGPSFSLQQ